MNETQDFVEAERMLHKRREKVYNFGLVLSIVSILLAILLVAFLVPPLVKNMDTSAQWHVVRVANASQYAQVAPHTITIDGIVYEKVTGTNSTLLSGGGKQAVTGHAVVVDPNAQSIQHVDVTMNDTPQGSIDASSLNITINGITYRPIASSNTDDMHDDSDEDDNQPKKRTTKNKYIVTDIDGNMVYLVKKGDTLSKVSQRVSYSVDELAKYNKIKNVNLIYTGEALRIPE